MEIIKIIIHLYVKEREESRKMSDNVVERKYEVIGLFLSII